MIETLAAIFASDPIHRTFHRVIAERTDRIEFSAER